MQDICRTPAEKGDQTFLRTLNTGKVLSALRRDEPLSRIELADITNLDKKTITNIINDMLDKKLVRICSRKITGAGRPKEMLVINGSAGYYVGLDLGGTHLSGVIIDFSGKVTVSHDIDVNNDMEPATLLKLCYHVVELLLKKAGLTEEDIRAIGIAFLGFVPSGASLQVMSENMPKWSTVDIHAEFSKKYGKPIFLEDCSRCMALTELWFGKGRDAKNFLVMDLGLGIGCGIVADGRIYAGESGKSGEVGHTVVDINGPACTCGSHGCIESLAAGWAISKQATAALLAGKAPILSETCGAGNSTPTPKEVLLAAELGDGYCRELMQKAGKYIGIGISNAISFFNPSRVIIGGRLVRDNLLMQEAIYSTIKAYCMPQIYADVEVVMSDLGLLASAWGAGIRCLM